MRNKDNHPGNFGGPKNLANPRPKGRYASLKPNGKIALRPQEKMYEGGLMDQEEL